MVLDVVVFAESARSVRIDAQRNSRLLRSDDGCVTIVTESRQPGHGGPRAHVLRPRIFEEKRPKIWP